MESLKKHNIPSIWHTDGNILPIMDRTLESGVTAIQCVDPLAGIDIVEVKKQVGHRLTLIGNLDCSLLQFGPVEKIEEETKRIVEGCKGSGGFVLCACNSIFKGISVKIICLLSMPGINTGEKQRKMEVLIHELY